MVLENESNMDMTREEMLSNASIKSKTYVNASYIKTPFRESKGLIIGAKGPQQKTEEAFWTMVLQNNVTQILAVCEDIGDGNSYYGPEAS